VEAEPTIDHANAVNVSAVIGPVRLQSLFKTGRILAVSASGDNGKDHEQ